MARTRRPTTRRVAAVERATVLLGALAAGGQLGTNELARRAGVHPSSVSRLLATLADAGLVEQVAETGRYRLGLRLVELGNAVLARLDLREVARPHLRALAEESGETATLSAPGDPDAITVDFVLSAASVQSVARVGRPSVAHATAAGKIGLAFGDVELPSGKLTAFTERTIVDRAALAREVERVREQGWAQALGEREDDLNAVAAPVHGSRGELVAVLGIQGPASRFGEEAMGMVREPLLARAAAVSDALGWRPTAKEGL
jgi:DNA-binding IclR family transcriptional regulator